MQHGKFFLSECVDQHWSNAVESHRNHLLTSGEQASNHLKALRFRQVYVTG
jgi:hypothetical protein